VPLMDNNVRSGSGRIRRTLAHAWTVVLTAATAIWLYGQAVRDSSTWEAVAFYLPSPLLAVSLIASAGIGCWLRHRRRATLYAMLAVLPAVFVGGVENHWQSDAANIESVPRDQRLRIVHWNVAHGGSRWQRQTQRVRNLDADVVVITEPPAVVRPEDFPGYSLSRLPHMLVAVRGTQRQSGTLVPGGALHAFLIECETDAGRLRLMVADMTSRILVPRDPYLRKMMTASTERQADVIVGDLNAPRRSLALTDEGFPFRHAYSVVGVGWGYTWPVPAPVLAIDQCLIGQRVEPLAYRLVSTLESDHRLQCFDFRLKEFVDRGDNSGDATSE